MTKPWQQWSSTIVLTQWNKTTDINDAKHDMLNWFKATKKRVAKGELSDERLKKFNDLLEVADKYRRLNQYK